MDVPDEYGVFLASGCLSVAGGLALYIQQLFDKDGNRIRPGSVLAACGSMLAAGVLGLSLALVMFLYFGETVEGRLAIIGINGLVSLGLISVKSVLPAMLKSFIGGDKTDGGGTDPRRTPRPDSDSRPA